MKRTRKLRKVREGRATSSRPDLILTSDWHLREDKPICRTDDFWSAQWGKVIQVAKLQEQFHCPVIHAGDLFHHWKASPHLLSYAITYLPKKFWTVFGQHDLPQHNFELNHKTGINTLRQSKTLRVIIDGGSWGQGIGEYVPFERGFSDSLLNRKIGVWHKFVWDGKHLPWPSCDEMTAKEVLKKYPEFDLIVTGDHHKPFTYEYQGRLLVNPGCLTRQAADYSDHQPRVYLYYADDNTVEPYYLSIEENVVSREHLEKQEQRDERIEAFISRLSDEWEGGLSFEENLRRFFSGNRIRKDVMDVIHKAIEG